MDLLHVKQTYFPSQSRKATCFTDLKTVDSKNIMWSRMRIKFQLFYSISLRLVSENAFVRTGFNSCGSHARYFCLSAELTRSMGTKTLPWNASQSFPPSDRHVGRPDWHPYRDFRWSSCCTITSHRSSGSFFFFLRKGRAEHGFGWSIPSFFFFPRNSPLCPELGTSRMKRWCVIIFSNEIIIISVIS